MEKQKVKVNKVNLGKYDCDSIIVKLDNIDTEICFSKDINVSQFEGKEVNIVLGENGYVIEPIKATQSK